MNKDKNINTLNEDELMKICGDIFELPNLNENHFVPGGIVYVRFIKDDEIGPWLRLTEEILDEIEIKQAAGYRIRYMVVTDDSVRT